MADDLMARQTLIQRLHDEIAALTRATAFPQSDDAMNERLDELFTAVCRLTHAPALTTTDLDLKLSTLCRRLRDNLDPDDRGAVLTYLLAEAVRDDHLLSARDPADVPTTCKSRP